MASRVVAYDRKGNALGEFEANVTRTWQLNRVGQANFKLSNYDPKAIQRYVQFGTLLYITHDKLPAWGGMIDPPRTWDFGSFEVTAYSGEYLLKQLRGPLNLKEAHSAGVTMMMLCKQADGWTDWPLKIGDYDNGGATPETENHLVNVLETLQEYSTTYKNDFAVNPVLSNGKLTFEVRWYEKRGIVRQLRLEEDSNCKLAPNPFTEQGEIYNDWYGYDSTEGSWANRMKSRKSDTASKDKYGARHNTFTHSIGHQQAASDNTTQKTLDASKEPRRTFTLTVLDVGDAFMNIDVGDTLPIKLGSVGFTGDGIGVEGSVRVAGMTYDDMTNELEIVSDEEDSE
jgi:hypothetical protein